MKKYSVHVIWLIVAIAAFAGGMFYSQSAAPAPASGGNGRGNFTFSSSTRGFGGRGGNGGGFVAGKILSKDSQSITVQLPNGNSEVVFYSSSTQIVKPSPATANDLSTGTNVMIGGTPNADGSVTAQTIQIRENGFGRGGSGGGQQ